MRKETCDESDIIGRCKISGEKGQDVGCKRWVGKNYFFGKKVWSGVSIKESDRLEIEKSAVGQVDV